VSLVLLQIALGSHGSFVRREPPPTDDHEEDPIEDPIDDPIEVPIEDPIEDPVEEHDEDLGNPDKSAAQCIKTVKGIFGQSSWKKSVKFNPAGRMTEAPLSLAVFAQCWWEVDGQSDATGLPSSEATKKSITDPKFANWEKYYTILADAVKPCEERKDKHDLGTIAIVDDYPEGIDATVKAEIEKKKELYKVSLELDTCTNEFWKPEPNTDRDEFKDIIPQHDGN